MLPWIVGTFLFLLAYLGGVIISIILIGTSRFEILLLLGFAIVEAAIGFYLWVCIVSLFQVNNSTNVRIRFLESGISYLKILKLRVPHIGFYFNRYEHKVFRVRF